MCAKWKDNANPDPLLQAMYDSYHTVEFDYYFPAILSFVEFLHDFQETECVEAVKIAIDKAFRDSLKDADSIIELINAEEQRLLEREPKDYLLLTFLSFRPIKSLKRFTTNGVTLYFGKEIPQKIDTSFVRPLLRRGEIYPPPDYTAVKVFIPARKSEYEAFAAGRDAVDFFRGTWNLLLNSGTFELNFGRPTELPFNKIIEGPIRTLYFSDGKRVSDSVWIDSTIGELPTSIHIDLSEYLNLKKFSEFVRRKLSKIRYKDRLINAIIRYCRSLDDSDSSSAFLRLWILLETLTGLKGQHQISYDVLIRRTSFIYKNPDLQKTILAHLRAARNDLVHLDRESSYGHMVVYQLRSHVEKLLSFHFEYGKKFNSIGKAAELMDTGVDKNVLRQRSQLYKMAIKLRE